MPGVFASALGIYNFRTEPLKTLSYKVKIINATTSGAVLSFNPVSTGAGIMSISFSVIVIVQNSTYLELVTLTLINNNPGSEPLLNANSSNFDFQGG